MNGGAPAWSPEALRVVALTRFGALPAVVGILAVCALAGHAGARMRFRWRGPLFWAALVLLLIPDHVILPAQVVSSAAGRTLGGQFVWRILGSHHLRLHLALGLLLLRQCFRHIPVEYEEAAWLEGAGPWRAFCRVELPRATGALALLAIFLSRAVFDALHEFPALPPALRATDFAAGGISGLIAPARDWRNDELAGILVGTVPLLLVWLFGRRQLLRRRVSAGIRD